MARCDTLDLEIFAGVSSQLQDLCCEILEYSGGINCRCGADTLGARNSLFEMAMNAADWKLESRAS